MKTLWCRGLIALAAGVALGGGFALANQQEQPQREARDVEVDVEVDVAAPQAGVRLGRDGQEPPLNFRIDDIAGRTRATSMDVRDRAGEHLGNVQEVVINASEGKVQYFVLSFGGFLGLGDKLFAVPLEAFTLAREDGDYYFLFDVTRERLEQAPGFDRDNWPDTADPRWAQEIDAFYQPEAERNARAPQDRQAEGERGIQADREQRADARDPREAKPVYRAEFLKRMDVRNDEGEDLGNIHELVINLRDGSITYAVLSFGGFLGLGDKLFAIPWDALEMQRIDEDLVFVLNVPREVLEDAPGFERDDWPDTADPQWAAQIDAHYRDHTKRGNGVDR